jgi:hypothetical protein
MGDEKNEFQLTNDHIKLLSVAYVSWDDGEYGAPAIDCKRPYGNSSVEHDIIEILGWEAKRCPHCDEYLDEAGAKGLREKAAQIHIETKLALQVILRSRSFVPGLYRRSPYHQDWKLIISDEVKKLKEEGLA